MIKYLLSIALLYASTTFAQIPEDALRYSWLPVNATARVMAAGGVMGSLGGDISATFVNPAGIGFFRTNEVVFSPGMLLQNNRWQYRDNPHNNARAAFNFSPSGVVLALGGTRQSHGAVSIALSQTANFNNQYSYGGLNNYSSFSESFAEEFKRSNLSINQVLNTSSPLPFTAAPALYTYLIDTITINGSTIIRAAPENILDNGQAIDQRFSKTTGGGIYELGAALAETFNDKWFFGAALGIPILYYKSNTIATESDTSAANNGFNSFTYQDKYTTSGVGVNIKLGVIYRPKEYIRLGLAVHTPTFYSLTDKRTTSLKTDLDNNSTYEINSAAFTADQSNLYDYLQFTPWKAMISASYVFRETADVKKQRAFLSADIEYINHRGTKFRTAAESPTADEKNYFNSLTSSVKNLYKGTFNFRVGGEIKFNTVMARLGFAYYGNPYKEAPIKARQMLFSGGIGYRHHGFFIDLTYVHHMNRNFEIPYRLADRLNTFASSGSIQGQICTTIGIKF